MIELTKITTPFGLLDAETQEALKAHGGPWEMYVGDAWADWSNPEWGSTCVYRVKPATPKPRECWSYGAHIRNTEAEAIEFRQRVANAHPGNGYELSPITKWIEVLP